ncbi:MAG TPA: anti-sigma regulatory factor [Puia sp.]|nr:anti-sigma regulatory factor [Puia sp.]
MILSLSKDYVIIQREQDVILFRNRVKEFAQKIKMSLVNQTKLITAASELVRNMLKYADGGTVSIEVVSKGRGNGIRLVFSDTGPGISDIPLAMKDGYSTTKSLGLGLPGAKRLVNDFNIVSEVNKGTVITIIKWANG